MSEYTPAEGDNQPPVSVADWYKIGRCALGILMNGNTDSVQAVQIRQVPTALPMRHRSGLLSEDGWSYRRVASDDLLALTDEIDPEKGVPFSLLDTSVQRDCLMRRIFDVTAISQDETFRRLVDERNRRQVLTDQPPVSDDDLIHATSPGALKQVLAQGLLCGEAIDAHDGSVDPAFPFTVSFLGTRYEPDDSVIPLPQNSLFGLVNLIARRPDPDSPIQAYRAGRRKNQWQIFGGLPATEIKSIILRDKVDRYEGNTRNTSEVMSQEDLRQRVSQAVVDSGMYIPIYRQSSGELLFTPADFDAMR